MQSILFLLALSSTAQAQTEGSYRFTYQAGSQTHQVCGNSYNTNALIRSQTIGEIESRATLRWKTTTTEAISVQIDEIEGAGQSPLWDKFYTASLSKGERIEVLKDAIQGIGDATAPHVFPYFFGQGIKKPRTWKDFSARIREAGSDLEYRTCQRHELSHCIRASTWVPKVLDQYASENRENLGYTKAQITGIRVITRTEEHSRAAPERNKTLRYAVQFTGFKLLPGECDSVTVTYSERGIENQTSTHNANQAEATHVSERVPGGRDALILVTAQGRKAIGPSHDLAQVSVANGNVSIQKSDALARYAQNREFAATCRLNAQIEISAVEKTSWYDWVGNSRKLGTRTFVVNPSPAAQIESITGFSYDAQKEVLHYNTTLSFGPGCPFFNTRPL